MKNFKILEINLNFSNPHKRFKNFIFPLKKFSQQKFYDFFLHKILFSKKNYSNKHKTTITHFQLHFYLRILICTLLTLESHKTFYDLLPSAHFQLFIFLILPRCEWKKLLHLNYFFLPSCCEFDDFRALKSLMNVVMLRVIDWLIYGISLLLAHNWCV